MSHQQSFSYIGTSLPGSSTKLGLMCLAQGHNAVTPVRLEPTASRSRVKHSTTETLRSSGLMLVVENNVDSHQTAPTGAV